MDTFFAALKKKPLLIGGLILGAVVLIYYVYKKGGGKANNAAQSAGTAGSAADPNGQSGTLGGYIQFEEDVINPTPVNVTVGKTSTPTTTIINNNPPPKVKRTGHHERGGGGNGGHHIPVDIPPPHHVPGGKRSFGPVPGTHVTHIKSPVKLPTPPQHNTKVVKALIPPHVLQSPIPVFKNRPLPPVQGRRGPLPPARVG